MGRLGKVMLVAWRAQYLPGTQGVFDELCLLFLSWAAPWSHPPFQALYNPKKDTCLSCNPMRAYSSFILIHIPVLSITTPLCLLLFSLRGGGGGTGDSARSMLPWASFCSPGQCIPKSGPLSSVAHGDMRSKVGSKVEDSVKGNSLHLCSQCGGLRFNPWPAS